MEYQNYKPSGLLFPMKIYIKIYEIDGYAKKRKKQTNTTEFVFILSMGNKVFETDRKLNVSNVSFAKG